MFDRLRSAYRRWRVRRRRRKLIAAHARVFRARTGKSVGFTPLLYAHGRVVEEGLASFEEADDGTVRLDWHWPEDAEVSE